MDKKGGILIPRQHVTNSIENIQSELSLHDIWRIKNPNNRSFTWSKTSPFIFCRLDYCLISDNLHDLVTEVDILASVKTHHSSIVLELEDIQEDFTLKDALVGRLDEECDLLNYLFVLAKLHIWTCRKYSVTPNFRVFVGMVDVKYRTEIYIAAKNNRRLRKSQAKWQMYINARELVG